MSKRYMSNFFVISIIVMLIPIWGCGKGDSSTAPSPTSANAAITITPKDTSLSGLPAPARIPYYATVRETSGGKPMNEIKVYITGTFAAPYNGGAYYQFYSDKGCSNPVNSGFNGTTDENGVYEFCVVVTGAPFDDANGITVSSGAVIATASLKVK